MIPQPVRGGEVRREQGLAPPSPAGPRLRHAFALAKLYWTSRDWKFAWAALVVLIAIQFGGTWLAVVGNRWQQAFYDSFEHRQAARFGALMLAFVGIMAMQVGTTLVETYLQSMLSLRWRTRLTQDYIARWLGRNRFAEIERLRIIDNPDQRIAEDIAGFTGANLEVASGVLRLVLGVLGAVVSAISFGLILLETAEPFRFTLFGTAVTIPGSTIWYAVAYTFVASVVIVRIGRPYIRTTQRQQHSEADFRANLIHVRRNAGQIGFAGAVDIERASLRQTFETVRRNYRGYIFAQLGLQAGQGVYDRIGSLLPLFVLAPRYFSGAISFGQVMGARDAFATLTGNLSYFVQLFPRIGKQVANANRLKGLDDAIEQERPRGIGLSADVPAGAALATAGLRLFRPNGAPLLTVGDWTVRAGERWVVQGPSGAGKSTLLRAVAGLWPDGAGAVAMTGDGVVMFVPQRLYLPLGTLKAAICFPDPPERHDDAAIAALLDRVRLGEHRGEIHAVRVWQEELSPGEQQRIALARILLHRPTLLVLDEATSALDPDNARHFHRQMFADLPDMTLVSVVHDDRLAQFHTHCLTIADGRAVPGPIAEDYV